MERGLLWLPLLGIFSWLAWAGWNEYQKVEAYKRWAQAFETAKYDIYAVLGYANGAVTWGVPTRQGPIRLETIALDEVQAISLLVNQQPVESLQLPIRGQQGQQVVLELALKHDRPPVSIPFTEIALADRWRSYLQERLPAKGPTV
jgi:hypothetical protein